jgi:hypothetical protein
MNADGLVEEMRRVAPLAFEKSPYTAAAFVERARELLEIGSPGAVIGLMMDLLSYEERLRRLDSRVSRRLLR